MLKTIAIAGVSAAGGFFIAQQADKFLSKPGTKFDDKLINSPERKELLRNGIAAGSAVGLFAVLSKVL